MLTMYSIRNKTFFFRHFEPSDIMSCGGNNKLRPNAIPKIFDSANSDISPVDSDVTTTCDEINKCKSESDLLKCKVTELEKQISDMTIKHSLNVQKLQQKIYSLENKGKVQGDKLKKINYELNKEKHQAIKLRDVMEELRKNKYISHDDEKFLNVK